MKVLKSFYNKLVKVNKKLPELLGYGGLVPVLVSCIIIFFNPLNLKAYEIITIYSYAIIAFLGGIYWGIALNSQNAKTQNNKLRVFLIIWSILPSMLCIYVLSMKQIASVLLLSFGFLLSILVDEIFNKYLRFPIWYLFLRRSLSLLVILILITSYFILKK